MSDRETMRCHTRFFEEFTNANRPVDPNLDGSGWTFRLAEHNQHGMPQVIQATDASGRTAAYHIETIYGRPVRGHGCVNGEAPIP